MPKQKPGKSKQDYCTPPELLAAVKSRLCIDYFSIDLAASMQNAVSYRYYTEEDNSLREDLTWNPEPGGWAWLNPPFANIDPWVMKAKCEAEGNGANIVMLVPAGVGSNWWRDWVEPYAFISFLNGRLVFGGTPINPKTGKQDAYPKDCALLFYTPWGFTGNEIWNWRLDVPQLQQPELGED